jgi:hypothetical protein
MNWKRGFKRITFFLSLLLFAFWIFLAIIEGVIIEGEIDALWIGPLFGIASFVTVWVIFCAVAYVAYGICPIMCWIAKGFRDGEGGITMRKEIEQAKGKLNEINNMPNSGQIITTQSGEQIDSGQYERYKALRGLALKVGASYISTERQKTANEGELTEGIHKALQTASMIETCRIATWSWIISIIAVSAAWAAVVFAVLTN